jgi:two-component system response regulator NreC
MRHRRMPTLKILCLEDDTLIRELLVARLLKMSDFKTLIWEAGDGATGLQLAREHEPELIILDLGLPDMSGFKVIEALDALTPRPRVLILTASAPDQVLNRIHCSSISGLLLKSDACSHELLSAIRAVLAGRTYFSQKVLKVMAATRAKPGHFTKILSPREIELLPLFGYGWTNERIGERTGLSAFTVRTHRQNILGKLDLHTTEKLIRWAIINGFSDFRYEPKETDSPALYEPPSGWELFG